MAAEISFSAKVSVFDKVPVLDPALMLDLVPVFNGGMGPKEPGPPTIS